MAAGGGPADGWVPPVNGRLPLDGPARRFSAAECFTPSRRAARSLWTMMPVGRGDSARRLTGFRLARRVSFPAMGKKPKDRQGSPAVALRLQWGHPRIPAYGGYPYTFPQKFRRAKYGSRLWFLPGRWALMRCKIPVCAISPPRLVPTSRGRGCGIGGAPDGVVSMNRGRAGQCPAPTGAGEIYPGRKQAGGSRTRPYNISGETQQNRRTGGPVSRPLKDLS